MKVKNNNFIHKRIRKSYNPDKYLTNYNTLIDKWNIFCHSHHWIGEEDLWTFDSNVQDFIHKMHEDLYDWYVGSIESNPESGYINEVKSHMAPSKRLRVYYIFLDFLKSKTNEEQIYLEHTLNTLKPCDLVKVLYTFTTDNINIIENTYVRTG